MEPAAQQLQVVREIEQDSNCDAWEKPRAHPGQPGDPEADGTDQSKRGHRRQDPAWYFGSEWASLELVERVRGDSDREEEGQQGGDELDAVDRWGEAGADQNVGKVPGRVRRMEDRPNVAPPPTGPSCVIGGSERLRAQVRPRTAHLDFRPHMTRPPPTLIARCSTSIIPAAFHASTIRGCGQLR